jgi:hypothetical protein
MNKPSQSKIKVRIRRDPRFAISRAMVMREINEPGWAARYEVLAENGKWRMKEECDVIFDDEKFEVEEI